MEHPGPRLRDLARFAQDLGLLRFSGQNLSLTELGKKYYAAFGPVKWTITSEQSTLLRDHLYRFASSNGTLNAIATLAQTIAKHKDGISLKALSEEFAPLIGKASDWGEVTRTNKTKFAINYLTEMGVVEKDGDLYKLSLVGLTLFQTRKATTWIFQGNPKYFNIDDYLEDRKTIVWSIRQSHFIDEIQIGDEVFVWRADGYEKGSGGIVARAIVIERPGYIDDWENEYWESDPPKADEVQGAKLLVKEVRLLHGMIRRTDLEKDEHLKGLRILKMRNETNYRLNDTEAMLLKQLWEIEATPEEEDEEEKTFPEGKVYYRLHKKRERSRTLVNQKKEQVKREGEKLICQVCTFDFEKTYGVIGKDFIEVHHTKPISEMKENDETSLDDLAVVCSNCHRMLHRRRPWLTTEQLTSLLP
ncbi:EVE domain-containing protein [Heliobacterium mobile]|uniref:EVE domain-containing protein n=1 Tax=Heliobacterium mobile TaxID=28064 RepID=UPI0014787B3C|nr:EVE domain-containing protein [Heliobacterium mobile]